jgi:hypothetical protein
MCMGLHVATMKALALLDQIPWLYRYSLEGTHTANEQHDILLGSTPSISKGTVSRAPSMLFS